jgi:hypothetical protein
MTPLEAALVAEACTKSSVVWLRPPDARHHHLAWHVWHNDAVHVVYGFGEQMLPLLSGEIEVAVPSKETGQRIVTFVAQAQIVPARTPEWEAAAFALGASRLNAQDPGEQLERWASGALLTRVLPLRVLGVGAGDYRTPAGALPPIATEATTASWRPWHLRSRAAARRGRRRSADRA